MTTHSKPIIFVEGLPGAGKTTTARHLHAHLENLAGSQLFLESSPDTPVGLPWNYACAKQTIAHTTPTDYPLKSWQSVDQHASHYTIIESRLIQNTSLFWMLHNDDDFQAEQLPLSIINSIQHRPIKLIVLQPINARTHTQHTVSTRRTQHPNWLPFVIDLFEQTPWCQAKHLKGEASFIETMVYWDCVQRQLLPKLPIELCIIEQPSQDWDATLRRALNFIQKQK